MQKATGAGQVSIPFPVFAFNNDIGAAASYTRYRDQRSGFHLEQQR